MFISSTASCTYRKVYIPTKKLYARVRPEHTAFVFFRYYYLITVFMFMQ